MAAMLALKEVVGGSDQFMMSDLRNVEVGFEVEVSITKGPILGF